jgi:hypothetical protein
VLYPVIVGLHRIMSVERENPGTRRVIESGDPENIWTHSTSLMESTIRLWGEAMRQLPTETGMLTIDLDCGAFLEYLRPQVQIRGRLVQRASTRLWMLNKGASQLRVINAEWDAEPRRGVKYLEKCFMSGNRYVEGGS